MLWIVVLLLILYCTYQLYCYLYPPPDVDPHNKYVLISGCDSGFGRELAIVLDQKGFHVFAGIYNPENESALKNKLSSGATVFHLDITNSASIQEAYKLVKEKTDVLHALVNNAGIDQDGFIDWISLEFMRKMMDVNFFGHVEITKTFLPLLIAKRGSRVVNLCSVASLLAVASMSSYAASKFAFLSFTDCLRREMRDWGLHVCALEPGYARTPIIEGHVQTMRNMWETLSSDVKDRWGNDYFNNILSKRNNNLFIHFAESSSKVVKAIEHAVSSTKPKHYYRPGWQSRFIFLPLSMLPSWICDFILHYGRGRNVIPTGVHKQLKE